MLWKIIIAVFFFEGPAFCQVGSVNTKKPVDSVLSKINEPVNKIQSVKDSVSSQKKKLSQTKYNSLRMKKNENGHSTGDIILEAVIGAGVTAAIVWLIYYGISNGGVNIGGVNLK